MVAFIEHKFYHNGLIVVKALPNVVFVSWRLYEHQVGLETPGQGELLHLLLYRLLVELGALRTVVVAVRVLGDLPGVNHGNLLCQLE